MTAAGQMRPDSWSSACPDIPTSQRPHIPTSRYPGVPITVTKAGTALGSSTAVPTPPGCRVNKCCVAPTPPCPSRAVSPRLPAPSKPSAASISHREKVNPSKTAHRHRFVSPRWRENQQKPGVLLLSHLIIMNICWWPLPRRGRAGGCLASGFFQGKTINGEKMCRVLLVPKPGVTQHSQHGLDRGEGAWRSLNAPKQLPVLSWPKNQSPKPV